MGGNQTDNAQTVIRHSRIKREISANPRSSARFNADLPSAFASSGRAPCSSNNSTSASSPRFTAECKGVQPPFWRAFTSTPRARSARATESEPPAQALWIGRKAIPLRETTSGSASPASKIRAIASLPKYEARWRGVNPSGDQAVARAGSAASNRAPCSNPPSTAALSKMSRGGSAARSNCTRSARFQ
jgi:hypothetical protein